MTICKSCGANIPDLTDDNYNSQHTQIQCEQCGQWQEVELEKDESI